MGARRFTGPLFMFVSGTLVALQLILLVTREFEPTAIPDFLSPMLGFSPSLGMDIVNVVIIAMPILFLEYYLLAVPVAVIILLGTKIVKSTRYELNIMNIGKNFNGTQMLRRAAAPALFSVASAQMFRDPLKIAVFGTADVISLVPLEVQPLVPIVVSLMTSLVFMPVALLLFMPTWVLNDAGVVTHLKSDNLDLRQCPDTQGVGRWIANMLGGYALLAFPITMFISQFYEPIILPLMQGGAAAEALLQEGVLFYYVTLGLLWTIGLPFFVMAFILPVIMFNERMQPKSTIRILRMAKRLGAKIIRKEEIREIKRPTMLGSIDESANVELWAMAGGQEVVVSSKTVKKPKEKDPAKKGSTKSKKRSTDSRTKEKRKKKSK
jgi:hypothetical protein